jgi:hypothetical protein
MTDEANETDFTDERAKHLAIIQDVIERMANSSAWMKRLAIVVVGGAAAISAKGNGAATDLPALAVLLTFIFWWMDARYHQQERWFRDVFESVRTESHTQRPDFRVAPAKEIRDRRKLWGSAFTWSTFPFYAALAIFLLLAWRLGK